MAQAKACASSFYIRGPFFVIPTPFGSAQGKLRGILLPRVSQDRAKPVEALSGAEGAGINAKRFAGTTEQNESLVAFGPAHACWC